MVQSLGRSRNPNATGKKVGKKNERKEGRMKVLLEKGFYRVKEVEKIKYFEKGKYFQDLFHLFAPGSGFLKPEYNF